MLHRPVERTAHFFQIYKDLEGKRVQIIGWEQSESAMQVITESIARYDAKYGRK